MPYWRLAGFYFFYFSVLGVLVPYWGLHLQALGMSAVEIGALTGIFMLTRTLAPLLWGALADRSARRMRMVRSTALAACVAFAPAFAAETPLAVGAVMLLFSLFWNAALPVTETAVLHGLRARAGHYGRVRLWGSLGFIAAVAGLGPLIEARGAQWVVPALMVLLLAVWLNSLLLPEADADAATAHDAERERRVNWRPIALFLLASLLLQASHSPYYTFYSIYLRGQGYAESLIGLLWAGAVLAEIGVFLAMPFLLRRFSLAAIIGASFLLAAVRWLCIGWGAHSLAVLIVAQGLHAASFGSFHAAAVEQVYRLFPGALANRGQALYGALGFGLGGTLGSVASGALWERIGSAWTFSAAAGLALLAWLIHRTSVNAAARSRVTGR